MNRRVDLTQTWGLKDYLRGNNVYAETRGKIKMRQVKQDVKSMPRPEFSSQDVYRGREGYMRFFSSSGLLH